MIVKDGWKNFIDEVRTTGKPIVCFGVGAIATFIEGLFIDCGIWEKITFFLDNNPQKEGKTVGVSRKSLLLQSIHLERNRFQISFF